MNDSVNPFATVNATNIPQNLLSYNGSLAALYGISIKNFLLCIITLGIYSSWAINNIRKFCINSFSIGSDRLEYKGTGGQLFVAFLLVGVLYSALTFTADFATKTIFPTEHEQLRQMDEENSQTPEVSMLIGENGEFDINGCIATKSAEKCEELYGLYLNLPPQVELSASAQILLTIQVFFGFLSLLALIYFAKFSAARYRLSQTQWRGVSGGISGASTLGYIALRFRRLFLNIISLGYLKARSDLIAEEYILSNAYFGRTNFSFAPDFTKLDKINLITLLLAIPTLGLSRVWYRAEFLNYKYHSLSLGGIKFESSFSGGKLLWLYVSNLLITCLTLFIGAPFARHRSLKFLAENLRLMGNADSLQLIQNSMQANALGEGVNQAFGTEEIGLDFGVI